MAQLGTAKARRLALRQLLLSDQSGTQAELCQLLEAQGHIATQSTVSRDLKLLGAQRVLREDGNFAYHLRGRSPSGPFPGDMIVGVDHNESTVVVRTRVGRAQAVGLDIDALRQPDILGTLAGDDTVLIIPRSIRQTQHVAARIRELAGLGEEL